MAALAEQVRNDLLDNFKKTKLLGSYGSPKVLKPAIRLYKKNSQSVFLGYCAASDDADQVWGLYTTDKTYTERKLKQISWLKKSGWTVDKDFVPQYTIETYFAAARQESRLVEDAEILENVSKQLYPHLKQ